MRPASSRRVESHSCEGRAIFVGRGTERGRATRCLSKRKQSREGGRDRERDGRESSLSPKGEGDEGNPEKTAARQVSGQEGERGEEREEKRGGTLKNLGANGETRGTRRTAREDESQRREEREREESEAEENSLSPKGEGDVEGPSPRGGVQRDGRRPEERSLGVSLS